MSVFEEWLQRWERQQQRYMPDREERFEAIVEALSTLPSPIRVADLGAGPGSLARRILDSVPGATVLAVDTDPVLLRIGREALAGYGERLRFVDADLRAELGEIGEIDAAVSTTALHWLAPDDLATLYAQLAAALRPGGLFLNGDRSDYAESSSCVAAVAREIRERRREAAVDDAAETWEAWWEAAEAAPELAAEVTERRRRGHEHPSVEHHPDLAWHREALLGAGFTEADSLWQHGTDRVIVAIR